MISLHELVPPATGQLLAVYGNATLEPTNFYPFTLRRHGQCEVPPH